MCPNQDNGQLRNFDVAICGGGLAGLSLARQLKLNIPDLSVVLIERYPRPLPEATLKVGESTVELGAFYLGESLDLREYFQEFHYPKLGLRYFFGDTHNRFENRPEFGLSRFPKVSSYQIDRGILENDLRRMNSEMGVEMLEGYEVKEITLSNGENNHQIKLNEGKNGKVLQLSARWVVDAMGRRRYLQKKLGLNKPIKQKCSSAWFRLKGRVDLRDIVPPENSHWHERVPDGNRYYSTNHVMGSGYWVWLIPLSSNNTSLGIVTIEDIHPFDQYNTFERARQWIKNHEPALLPFLDQYELLDFRCMRKYTHNSQRVFSKDRWVCVGEAGVFSDPFYSPGTDFIGFANTIATEMIRLDREGRLSSELVDEFNQFYLSINEHITYNIQVGYPLFGNAVVMAAKLIWDFAAAWAILCPQMFNSIFLDPEKRDTIRQVTGRFFFLSRNMQKLFVDWNDKSAGRLNYEYIDYLSIPFLSALRLRNLQMGKDLEELKQDFTENMNRLEELAQVLFLLAVEDVLPEHLEAFPLESTWLNAWALNLDPSTWESKGLLSPFSKPRSLLSMNNQIRRLFSNGVPHLEGVQSRETKDIH